MKRPQLVSEGSLNRILRAAQEAWNQRDFKQAIDELERARRLAPGNAQILLQLGRSYGLTYDYASAERSFDQAIRIALQKTEALVAAGESAIDFINSQLAEKYLQAAAQSNEASPKALVALGELYERLRRVEDASTLVHRALRLDPNHPAALLLKARLNRLAGWLDFAEASIRPVLAAPDKVVRTRAFYEFGFILDRQGRYDEAMAAFLEAKALLQPEAGPFQAQLQHLRNYWGQMQADISAEVLQQWMGSATDLQPARRIAFLGGYARSGTTLLEQVLDSHTNIVSAEETTLFNDEVYARLVNNQPTGTPMLSVLDAAPPDLIRQLRANYFTQNEKHLGAAVGERLLVDKNPNINVLIPAFVRAFPEIKLLIALRDPRDVCLSCFMQAHVPLSVGSVSYLTLEETADAYARVMGLWRTLAPMLQGRYLEVRYEDVVEDLEPVARRTLEFLGVPWDERVLRFDEHARSKRVRSPTYADVAKPISKRAMGRWRNYQKYLEPHLAKLEPFLKAFGYEG